VKLIYYILICCLLGLSGCTKEEEEEPVPNYSPYIYNYPPYAPNHDVQWNIDNEHLFSDIVANVPIDSLYGKLLRGGLIIDVDIVNQYIYLSAQSNQSDSILWSINPIINTGASSTTDSASLTNTAIIISSLGQGDYAAYVCDSLEWFLPSSELITKMKINLHLNGYGDFGNFQYWSSTDCGGQQAYSLDFNPIAPNTAICIFKGAPNYFKVRGVRKQGYI